MRFVTVQYVTNALSSVQFREIARGWHRSQILVLTIGQTTWVREFEVEVGPIHYFNSLSANPTNLSNTLF